MKGRRWTREEDQLLREKVLDCITNGGTQLQAFEEIGMKLGRTSGACGFRWNAVLRQEDPKSYSEAKKKRVYKELQKRKGFQLDSMSQVVYSLKAIGKQCRQLREKVRTLQQRLEEKNRFCRKLSEENQKLATDCNSFNWYQKEVKEKYHDIMHVLDYLKNEATTQEKIELTNSGLAEIAVEAKSNPSS